MVVQFICLVAKLEYLWSIYITYLLSESLATPFDTVLYITIIVLRVYDAIKTNQGQPLTFT